MRTIRTCLLCLGMALLLSHPAPLAASLAASLAATPEGEAEHGASAPVVRPRPLASYPHNARHFTQGLSFDGDVLYESTGLYGRSVIAVKDPITGESLREQSLDRRFFGEGSVVAGGELYVLTWKEGLCLVADPETLATRRTFRYEGEGWGLTWDGRRLIRSDGSPILYFHDTEGRLTGQIQVTDRGQPVPMLNELEWIPAMNLVLANVWHTNRVAAVDPADGSVRFWLDLSDLVPDGLPGPEAVANGLALAPDGRSLWITGKLWPVIHKTAWPPELPASSEF